MKILESIRKYKGGLLALAGMLLIKVCMCICIVLPLHFLAAPSWVMYLTLVWVCFQ